MLAETEPHHRDQDKETPYQDAVLGGAGRKPSTPAEARAILEANKGTNGHPPPGPRRSYIRPK
jgi:hypothetical protein